jgi:phage gp36-like protein
MSYATQQDLIDRADNGEATLIELTDRAVPPTGLVDANVVAKAIADADALIDSYLQSRYVLPLASVPKSLTRASVDIALYDLYGSRAPKGVEDRYRDALRWLVDLSRGAVSLGLDENAQATTAQGGVTQTTGSARQIDDLAMAGYAI